MENNREFVKEFEDRASKHQILATKIKNIYEISRNIYFKKRQIIKEINKKVMGTGTSSLRRTSIIIGTEERTNYNTNPSTMMKVNEFLTFNQLGMGSIKQTENNSTTWGCIQSSELDENEIENILFDQNKVNEIKNDLIRQNANKLLRTFCHLESITPELKIIFDASSKLRDEATLNKELDIELLNIPKIQDHVLTIKPMKINKICIPHGSDIIFKGKYLISANSDEDEVTLDTNTIECAMVCMQITAQLNETLNLLEKELDELNNIIKVQENSINEKLAVYLVMSEMSEDK